MPCHAMKDSCEWNVTDCWHDLGKHCQDARGRHWGHHSHQHCHHHSGAGLGQGHPEDLPVPAQPMPSSPSRTGSIALLSQGHGTALQWPPTVPLPLARSGRSSVDTRGTGGLGFQGTGAHRSQSPWLLWTQWIWGSLGVPRTPNPAFVVTRVARGPMGAGDMREIPIAGSTPTLVCIHKHPGPRDAEGPGGPWRVLKVWEFPKVL